MDVFDWDEHNLWKIGKHRISRIEAEQAMLNDPIPIYNQHAEHETRVVYYSETDAARYLAIVATQRGANLRVVTAYDMDAGQKREYLTRRFEGD
jgi:uncharacterized DUF497 family protein